METFEQMKDRHEQERKSIKWGFAFSDKQFSEMMANWGLNADNPEDLKKIYSIGYGGYIQKKDAPEMHAIIERQEREEKELQKNKKFLQQQIEYEMGNHEYCITYDDEEILGALGMSADDVDEAFIEVYNKAKKNYFKGVA